MPLKDKPYLDKNRNQYINGQKIVPTNYTQPYVTHLENGKFICTCGDVLSYISCVYGHRRSLGHLQKLGLICESNPLTLKQQRDRLINDGARLW